MALRRQISTLWLGVALAAGWGLSLRTHELVRCHRSRREAQARTHGEHDRANVRSGPLRIGTFNIRFLGQDPTDLDRLRAVVASVDPAVLALQEVIRDEPARTLARMLSVDGRAYRVVSAECGGRSGLRVAFLFDEARVSFRGAREFPAMASDGDGVCTTGDRAALAGTFFAPSAGEFTMVSLHLEARSEPERVERRKAQWRRMFAIRERLVREGKSNVILLGDTNSTGWHDDAQGERTFIEGEASRAGVRVETGALACSEYFRTGERTWQPSMLDHIVAEPDVVRAGTVRLHGYCAELACRPWIADAPPSDYVSVSDHCPVTVELSSTSQSGAASSPR